MIGGERIVGRNRQMVAPAVEGVDGGAICTHACYSLGQDWKRVGVNVFPRYLHRTSMRAVSQEQQRKQHRHLQTTVHMCVQARVR